MQIPHIFLAQTRQLWELSTAALKLNIYFSVALQLNLMITSSLLQRRRLARQGWWGLLFDSAAKMRCLHLFSSRVQERRRIKMIIVMSRQCSTVCWPYLSNPQLWFSWCMNSLHFVIFFLSRARIQFGKKTQRQPVDDCGNFHYLSIKAWATTTTEREWRNFAKLFMT